MNWMKGEKFSSLLPRISTEIWKSFWKKTKFLRGEKFLIS